ncbi:hypothetical protein GN956_G5305 [Arapaima gigas]
MADIFLSGHVAPLSPGSTSGSVSCVCKLRKNWNSGRHTENYRNKRKPVSDVPDDWVGSDLADQLSRVSAPPAALSPPPP